MTTTIRPTFRRAIQIRGVEFVFQWCSGWWRFSWRTWVRWDRGNWSLGISFFWLEFFIFW